VEFPQPEVPIFNVTLPDAMLTSEKKIRV
jgi:hypothetical protein